MRPPEQAGSAQKTRECPCYSEKVIHLLKNKGAIWMTALLALSVSACHKEEQAVEGVARNAARAEQQAAANATERDAQRAELAKIPLPTKSLYVDIRDPSQWQNPFIAADAEYLDLHVIMEDANPSAATAGTFLRPEAARRQELQIRPADLARAITALPARAWPYGRVVAVAESPEADRKNRAAVRRNVEAAIQKLNDLGVVVEEWPGR
jgi:hypothetical protein